MIGFREKVVTNGRMDGRLKEWIAFETRFRNTLCPAPFFYRETWPDRAKKFLSFAPFLCQKSFSPVSYKTV